MLAAMFSADNVPSRITFPQRLSGRLTTVGPGLADVVLAGDGPTPLGAGTRLAGQLSFVTERSFRARGTIAVAGRDALEFTTIAEGSLCAATDEGVRHGTAVLHVIGLGPLAGVHGHVTSNFVVSDDGRVSDRQVLVLFPPQDHHQGGTTS
jgi:hypothetical protein